MPDRYIHLIRNGQTVIQQGDADFATRHDTTSPAGTAGVHAEWSWDGSCLRVRNCWHGPYPLYYFSTADEVCVSPSLPRLLAEGAPRDLDESAIALFLRSGCFLGNDTPFRSIRLLPPHAVGEWRTGESLLVSSTTGQIAPRKLTRDEAIDAFIEVFRAAVRRRPPRGEFAVPLSGGRDSRHILFELCEAGYRPKVCLTMRHFPPMADEDARIATIVADALGVKHEVLDPAASFVRAEMRKNAATGCCTDWSGWFLGVLDRLDGDVSDLYSGYGGDALSRAGVLDLKAVEFWHARDAEGLATYRLTKRPSRELALKLSLRPDAYDRFSLERARTRLVAELQRHLDQPNPDLTFTAENALRRRTAPHLFPMSSDVAHIFVPYLDYAVYELLASLPLGMLLDRGFHTDAIARAFPRYRDLPFEDKTASRRNDSFYFRQAASELTAYALSRGTSSIFSIRRVVERLSGCRHSGDGTLLQWMNPARILCLLQLEEVIETAGGEAAIP